MKKRREASQRYERRRPKNKVVLIRLSPDQEDDLDARRKPGEPWATAIKRLLNLL